tara:strand:- start:440 stop:685 length:246 start_codon:yes stop_codon:yes gene_type:complete
MKTGSAWEFNGIQNLKLPLPWICKYSRLLLIPVSAKHWLPAVVPENRPAQGRGVVRKQPNRLGYDSVTMAQPSWVDVNLAN